MRLSGEVEQPTTAALRVLCLGNELIADDAFGHLVAGELQRRSPRLSVVEASTSGFDLLDYLFDARRLVVIDTIQTGRAEPGTVHLFQEQDLESAPCASPHCTGLFEALALGRQLKLAVPEEVVLIAVEAADLTTLGGPVHPAVRAALREVVALVERLAT